MPLSSFMNPSESVFYFVPVLVVLILLMGVYIMGFKKSQLPPSFHDFENEKKKRKRSKKNKQNVKKTTPYIFKEEEEEEEEEEIKKPIKVILPKMTPPCRVSPGRTAPFASLLEIKMEVTSSEKLTTDEEISGDWVRPLSKKERRKKKGEISSEEKEDFCGKNEIIMPDKCHIWEEVSVELSKKDDGETEQNFEGSNIKISTVADSSTVMNFAEETSDKSNKVKKPSKKKSKNKLKEMATTIVYKDNVSTPEIDSPEPFLSENIDSTMKSTSEELKVSEIENNVDDENVDTRAIIESPQLTKKKEKVMYNSTEGKKNSKKSKQKLRQTPAIDTNENISSFQRENSKVVQTENLNTQNEHCGEEIKSKIDMQKPADSKKKRPARKDY